MTKFILIAGALVGAAASPCLAEPIRLKGTGDVAGLVAGAAGQDASTATAEDTEKLKVMADYISAQAALRTAQTAAETARAAAATANLGPLASTANTGLVTASANAGSLQGRILAARATADAADKLAARICGPAPGYTGAGRCAPGSTDQSIPIGGQEPSLTQPVPNDCATFASFAPPLATRRASALVIMAEGHKTGFDAYDLLTIRFNAAGRELCSAIVAADTADARTIGVSIPVAVPPKAAQGLVAGFLPGISAGIDLVGKLFRSEYTVADIAIKEDDQLLEKECVRALLARNVSLPIYAPDLHTVVDLANNPFVEKLMTLDRLVRQAEDRARAQTTRQSAFAAGAKLAKGEAAAVLASAAGVHDASAKSLAAALQGYSGLLSTASAGEADKPNLMTTAIRQAKTADLLRSGSMLLVVKMDAAGGTTYTKKNFFTAFGAMPFFASGGVVASYALVDGSTGRILDASSVPVSGGFKRVSEIR
ncbi:hypothetical protein [Sphingomonas sp. R86521]|uniref:hypothetical protein n=1 Tax=Sphingomonas sp. R86521 TaxID=3093860 RepID=UPI0036D27E04